MDLCRVSAGIVLCAVALAGCSGSPSGPTTGGGSLSLTFCRAYAPIWLAVQDGNGAWTRVLPNPGTTTYQFSPPSSDKAGLALVDTIATYPSLAVSYESSAEFTAQFSGYVSPRCGVDSTGTGTTKTVNGSVANVGATERAEVSLGSSSADVKPGFGAFPLFQLTDVRDGPIALVATRGDSSELTYAANKVIVRRALSPADNSTLAQLDFGAEGFVPDSANVTVTGLGTDSASVSSAYITTGGGLALSQTFFGAASQWYRAIPLTQLNATDVQVLFATAQSASGVRVGDMAFRNPVDRTLSLPALNTPTVTTLVTAPNARPRVQLASQAEYNRGITAAFTQSTPVAIVLVGASAGYYGGAPVTWDITVPDLSTAAGWNSAWGLQDGNPIGWFLEASGGSDSTFQIAETFSATLLPVSSTPLAVRALRTGPNRFQRLRRLLDAVRSRAGRSLTHSLDSR